MSHLENLDKFQKKLINLFNNKILKKFMKK